jgi:N-acetylmuramoyl-L-alanine amidase
MTPRKSTDYLVIHCAATRPSQNIGAKDIDRWHRAQGWLCIGYAKVIRRDGTIENGRDENVPGAHVGGHNHNSVGVCMAGGVSEHDVNVPENNFTPAQFASLEKVLREWLKKWPNAKVLGHKDFPKVAKACPSFEAIAWAKSKGFRTGL